MRADLADFGKQAFDFEPGPLPRFGDGGRLAVEKHLAVGTALDKRRAKQALARKRNRKKMRRETE